jgi:hypothetical protein
MFSEIAAENTAKELEKVLLDAINGNYWSEHRSPIKGFCKKHIWPLYVAAVDDSYTLSINKELKEIFDPIQK